MTRRRLRRGISGENENSRVGMGCQPYLLWCTLVQLTVQCSFLNFFRRLTVPSLWRPSWGLEVRNFMLDTWPKDSFSLDLVRWCFLKPGIQIAVIRSTPQDLHGTWKRKGTSLDNWKSTTSPCAGYPQQGIRQGFQGWLVVTDSCCSWVKIMPKICSVFDSRGYLSTQKAISISALLSQREIRIQPKAKFPFLEVMVQDKSNKFGPH